MNNLMLSSIILTQDVKKYLQKILRVQIYFLIWNIFQLLNNIYHSVKNLFHRSCVPQKGELFSLDRAEVEEEFNANTWIWLLTLYLHLFLHGQSLKLLRLSCSAVFHQEIQNCLKVRFQQTLIFFIPPTCFNSWLGLNEVAYLDNNQINLDPILSVTIFQYCCYLSASMHDLLSPRAK